MTTLFKKSLVASAVLAFAGVANAAVIDVMAPSGTKATAPTSTEAWYTASLDGLLNKTGKEIALVADADTDADTKAAATAGNMVFYYKAGAAIPVNDVVTIKFTGATIKSGAVPVAARLADAAVAEAGVLEFIDIKDNNTVRFRVTTAVVKDTTFDLSGLTLVYGNIAANASISAEVKTISQNTIIGEYDTKSQVLLTAKAQTTATATTAYDEKIATAKERKAFAGAATDSASITPVNNQAAYAYSDTINANGDKIVYTLKATVGDFSFVRDGDKADFGGNGDGTLSSAEIAKSFNNVTTYGNDGVTYALSADNKTVTVTQTGATDGLDVAARTFVLSPLGETASTRAKASAIPVLTVTADVKFTSAAPKDYSSATALDLGKLVLDGSVVKVPFMAVQEGKWSGVVRVSNSSSQDGNIKLDIYDVNGDEIVTNYAVDSARMAKKNSSVNVYPDILAALKSKSIDTVGKLSQVSVTIVTEVPADSVQVYSAFTDESNKNRYIVNNDGKVQFKN